MINDIPKSKLTNNPKLTNWVNCARQKMPNKIPSPIVIKMT